MRLSLEVRRNAHGTLEGIVHPGEGRDPEPFVGLIELVSVLESELDAFEKPATRMDVRPEP
jgi:hypothetical protein